MSGWANLDFLPPAADYSEGQWRPEVRNFPGSRAWDELAAEPALPAGRFPPGDPAEPGVANVCRQRPLTNGFSFQPYARGGHREGELFSLSSFSRPETMIPVHLSEPRCG